MSAIETVIAALAKRLRVATQNKTDAQKHIRDISYVSGQFRRFKHYEHGYFQGACAALQGVLEILKEEGCSVEPADAGSPDNPAPNHEQE